MTQTVAQPFLEQLNALGMLIPSGIPGVYGRGETFENIAQGLEQAITQLGQEECTHKVHFPPIMNRQHFQHSGFMKSFPQLAGFVHAFHGDSQDHHQLLGRIEQQQPFNDLLPSTELVLTPAACYPLYPALKGTLPSGGVLYDVSSYCFRHEPSVQSTRLQAFRQREYVRVGTEQQVLEWRERWTAKARTFLEGLGLQVNVEAASDAFFGPGGRLLKANQRDQGLKHELLVEVAEQPQVAVISLNYHRTLFAETFAILNSDTTLAHTSCIGFGMERLVLALLWKHGVQVNTWPTSVREQLCL